MPDIKRHSLPRPTRRHSPPPKRDDQGQLVTSSVRTAMYDHRWRQARLVFLRHHPLCVVCLEGDRVTAAEEVDHIIPHKGDSRLFWNQENWQALCTKHHSQKTAREVNEARRLKNAEA